MGATMQRVLVDDVGLEFDDHGSGEPVLFIHGSGPADSFVPLAIEPSVRDRYRVIRYHRRGWAGSSPVQGPVAVARHAADCRGLLDALDIAKAHVVGHSYGAAVALQLALDTPEVVHTVGLFDGLLVTVPSAPQLFEALGPAVQRYMAGDRAGAADAFFTLVNGPDWRNEIGRTVPGGPEQAEKDVAGVFESDAPSGQDWRFGPEEAAQITQPVFFLLGSDSLPVFAETRDLLRAWLAEMEDDVLPGANHLLHMRHPAEAATRLVEFLQRHPLSG